MGLFSKRSKMYAIANMKCPKCHEGDLFETPTMAFKKSFDMPSHCSHCGQAYEPEPGFYYGAMFIAYAISGWFSIFFLIFFHWVLRWDLLVSFGVLVPILALGLVWIFRISRSIYINMMIGYDKDRAAAAKQ